MDISLTLTIYNRYKDRFNLFKEEHPMILEKYPEAVGDWDSWLLKTGIKEVIKSKAINTITDDFNEEDKKDIAVHRITFYVLETSGAEDILVDGIAYGLEGQKSIRGLPSYINRDKIRDDIIEEEK